MANKGKSSRSGKSEASGSRRKTVHIEGAAATVYSNNVELVTTPWDIKFTFGQIERADKAELVVRDSVCVYLSPQHALALYAVLGKQLNQYESSIGPIPRIGAAKENGEAGDKD